jgi:5'-nucleotidase
MKRPQIIITNDDGIHAIGIKLLWEALHKANFADLYVIAPADERSGSGASITCDRPLAITKIDWPEATPAWSISGTPADCIKMGERVLLGKKPDFIVSGINAGSNAGRNVLHSGTIGACIEGAFRGIPAMAFSCEDTQNPNYHLATQYVASLVHYALEHPLPPGCILNANFPHSAQHAVEGVRLTRQGKGRWSEDPYLHTGVGDSATYWLGGKPEELGEEDDSDVAWLKKGYLTVVPLHVNELTDHAELQKRHPAFENYFIQKHLLKNES